MEEIKEKAKQVEDKFGGVLMQANTAIIDANERIGKISQRLGRIISKSDKIDDKNTLFLAWLQDYISLKDNVKELWSTLWRGQMDFFDFCSTQNISLSNPTMLSISSCTVYFARFHAKVEVLDDVLVGLMEDLFDNVLLEQKEKTERKVKEAIEKTNELPMFV
jgi:hypothetical protein